MTEFDPSLKGMEQAKASGMSKSVYTRNRVRWLQRNAKQEGYKGSLAEYVPRGYTRLQTAFTATPNKTLWRPESSARSNNLGTPFLATNALKPQQTYWDNPVTVGRWYQFLQLQDKDYTPPAWLNKDAVSVMYKNLKAYNGDEDWMRWKPLPFGTEGNYFSQFVTPPPGTQTEETPVATRTQTLAEKRLPTIMGNIQTAVANFNAGIKANEAKEDADYSDYAGLVKFLEDYNVGMENVLSIDPELYKEMGGTLDIKAYRDSFAGTQGQDMGQIDWEKLAPWARFMLSLTSSGDMQNRPEWTRATAAGLSAGLSGVMAGSMAKLGIVGVGAVAGAIAAKTSAPLAIAAAAPTAGQAAWIIPTAAFIIGAGVAIYQYDRAMKGVNTTSPVDNIFRAFGILGEWTEQAVGTAQVAAGEGIHSTDDLVAAWRAAQFTWDAGNFNLGDWMTDAVSKTAYALNSIGIGKDWSDGYTTQAGQVWQLAKGLDTPQNTDYWGPAAINEAYKEIKALGADPTKEELELVYAKWTDKFGYSGSMNNMAGQLLLDPTNFVPLVSDAVIKKYADVQILKTDPSDVVKLTELTNLKNAASAAMGNPLTDALPMGIQQLWEGLVSRFGDDAAAWWRGSKTPVDILMAANAANASAMNKGAILNQFLKVEFTDADGNKTYGTLQDVGNWKYVDNGQYRVVDDAENVYTIDNNMRVIKAVDANGNDLPDALTKTAAFDPVAIESGVMNLRKAANTEFINGLEKLMKAPTDSAQGKLRDLLGLQPVAKVHDAERNLMEFTINASALAGNSAQMFVDLVRYYAGVGGDIEQLGAAAKEFGLGGTVSLANVAMRDFVKSDEFSNIVSSYFDAGAINNRAALKTIAEAIKVDVHKIISKNPEITAEQVFIKLQAADPQMAQMYTVDTLKDMLKPYQSEKPQAITDSEFTAGLNVSMVEGVAKFLAEKAGVTELPALTRFTNLMKQAMGISVITLNVPAWITNFFTNEVTTSLMIGSSMFQSETNIRKFYERAGLDQQSIHELIGAKFGLTEEINQVQSELYKTLNPPKSWITKAQRTLSKATKSIPVLKKISDIYPSIEDFSKGRAMAGAMKDFMDMTDLSAIPNERMAVLLKYFTADQIKSIQKVAKKAYTGEELMNQFVTGLKYNTLADDTIESTFKSVAGNDPTKLGLMNELFNKTDMKDWLLDNLPKCKTPEDIENLRTNFHDMWDDSIRAMSVNSLANEVPSTGIELYKSLNRIGLVEYNTQLSVNKHWEATYDRLADITDPGLRDTVWKNARQWQKQTWERTWDTIRTSADKSIRAAGLGDYADRYVAIIDARAKASKEYFNSLDTIEEDFYYRKQTRVAKEAHQKEVNALTTSWRDKTIALEKQAGDLWVEMMSSSGPAANGLQGDELIAAARKFVDGHLQRKIDLRNLVDKHYRDTRGVSTGVRQQMSEEFYSTRYQPAVANIISSFMEDYNNLFNKVPEMQPRTMASGTQVKTPETPAPGPTRVPETQAPTAAPEVVNTDRIHVEANNARNNSSIETHQIFKDVVERGNGIIARTQVQDGLAKVINDPAQSRSLNALMDTVAKTWADVTGKDPSQWYQGYFGAIEQYDGDTLKNGMGAAGIKWDEDGRAVISFTKSSNLTSAAHEVKHIYLRMLTDLYLQGLSKDLDIVAKSFGDMEGKAFADLVKGADTNSLTEEQFKVYEDISEKFVDGATKWELESVPMALRPLFNNFTKFLKTLFEKVKKVFDNDVPEQMNEVYRKLYASYDQFEPARKLLSKASAGVTKTLKGESGQSYEVIPIVVDMDWITASHQMDGSHTIGFPQELQPREYRTDFILSKARALDPQQLLTQSINFSYGLPVVNQDGLVLVGNHRYGMLRQSIADFPAQYDSYKAALPDFLADYGLTLKDLESIDNPILVYKLADETQVKQMVDDANIPSQQAYSQFENAIRRANKIDPELLTKIVIPQDKKFSLAIKEDNQKLFEAFLGTLSGSEKSQYLTPNGAYLTDDGVRAISQVIAAYSYGGTDDGRRFIKLAMEYKGAVSANITDALIEASPFVAKVKSLVETGKLDESYDISKALANAAFKYADYIASGKKFSLEQNELFPDNQKTPNDIKFLQVFERFGRSKALISKLVETISDNVASIAETPIEQSAFPGFGPDRVSAEQAISGALDKILGYGAKELEAIEGVAKRAAFKNLTTTPASTWQPELSSVMKNVLKEMGDSIKTAQAQPPEWMNVQGLYDGDAASYRTVRKAIKDLIAEYKTGEIVVDSKVRNLLLQQAFTRVIGENQYIRDYLGIAGDNPAANKAISDTLFQKLDEVANLPPVEKQMRLSEITDKIVDFEDALKANKVPNANQLTDVLWKKANDLSEKLDDGDVASYTQSKSLFQDTSEVPETTPEPEPVLTPISSAPVGANPAPRQDWLAWNELLTNQLDPLFNQVLDSYKAKLGKTVETLKYEDIPSDVKAALQAQLRRWSEDIKLKKAGAINYGKAMVDHTLLNYTAKTNLDGLLQHIFPYHFWYTQSIIEWSKALISRPAIAGTYYKYRELLRRNTLKGTPSRFAGKSPIYAPWLPDELGDTLWINPLSKFFPLASMVQPFTTTADLNADMSTNAVNFINQQVREGKVSQTDAAKAIAERSGQLWLDGIAYAQMQNTDSTDPMSALSWSMLPAPWFTIPYYAATGQKDKITVFPHTRMGQAMEAWDVPIISAIGKVLAYPETKLREVNGLSPYGEWGDYYIEFMLSNLATSNKYDTDTIIRAMIEKSGAAYDEAKALADDYLSYRLPGSALVNVLKSGQLEYIPQAMLATMFPAGLYPKGEMIQRGLSEQYSMAWKQFLGGDNEALNKFMDENPEYEARLALFKEPEDRLHSHLVNLLWDKWIGLSDPDKKLVQEQFGQAFKSYFLDSKSRNYDLIDNDTLAYWNRQLGATVPNTPETKDGATRTIEPLELYNQDISEAGQSFIDERKVKYPNYWWLQNLYYELPKEKQDDLLRAYPELQDYWDWRDNLKETNPALKKYLDDQGDRAVESDATHYGVEAIPESVMADWDSELAVSIGMHVLTGKELSEGAKAELNRIWVSLGKPGGDLYTWIDSYLGAVRP